MAVKQETCVVSRNVCPSPTHTFRPGLRLSSDSYGRFISWNKHIWMWPLEEQENCKWNLWTTKFLFINVKREKLLDVAQRRRHIISIYFEKQSLVYKSVYI